MEGKMKILLAGESFITTENHTKGFDFVTLGRYEQLGTPFVKTLQNLGMEVTYLPNHIAQLSFPDTVDELAEYDVVILSDIGSNTLLLHPDMMYKWEIKNNRLEAIKEYVLQGGSLLMIGGYLSFCGIEGKARYGMTPVADVLPVKIMNYDDRIDTPEGVSPVIVDKSHPIVKGIKEPWPRYLGYNYLEERPGTQVILKIRNSVGLAAGEYGKGRSVASAIDCLPHWALPEVLSWKYYSLFWKNIIEWLTEKKR
jgi:uncharacterized membrane protein